MSEFKGTPGKFTHDVIESCSGEVFVSVLDADGVSIAFCGKDKIAEANAQLFSAAPDLLAVLQSIVELQTRGYIVLGEKYTAAMNDAIAKARGETK